MYTLPKSLKKKLFKIPVHFFKKSLSFFGGRTNKSDGNGSTLLNYLVIKYCFTASNLVHTHGVHVLSFSATGGSFLVRGLQQPTKDHLIFMGLG